MDSLSKEEARVILIALRILAGCLEQLPEILRVAKVEDVERLMGRIEDLTHADPH